MIPRPLPQPYLCSDSGSFAENTLLVRLPEIASRIIKENQFSAQINQRIEGLIAELPDGIIRPVADPGAPDLGLWQNYLAPYTDRTWHALSFLACENTFYRQVLAATAYFQPGSTHRVDPYAYQKRTGLETSLPGIRSLAGQLDNWRNRQNDSIQALNEAIEVTLWSNRADLSLWPADSKNTLSHDQLHQANEFLLANDLPELVQMILQNKKGQRIDFLIDNAGYELVCDLALADLLLSRRWADRVFFHLKVHPTFVSDALVADVQTTIAILSAYPHSHTAAFGKRLSAAVETGRLVLQEQFFWNSPLLGWEMPDSVRMDLAEAALVISKGDANYRRMVGDLRWPETTPFPAIIDYLPTRLAALRTAKSEVIVGLKEGQVSALNLKEPSWRTNGRWGVIQLS
jgi:hypothetical protein